jgi:hypothetical protein
VFAESLDGKPLALDPGVHAFRFEAKGAPAIEEQVVVRHGEKNRIYTVTMQTSDESGTIPSDKSDERSATASPPILGYVLGGLGIAAGVTALYLVLDANGDASNLRDTCAPQCKQSDVDDIEEQRVVGGVVGGVGGALLIAGIILVVTHRGADTSAARSPLTVAPARGGGAAVLRF